MSNAKANVTVNFPIFGAIGLILVILKLGGVAPVAAWSWWLVTMPFWIGIVISLVVAAIFGVVAAIFGIIALLIFLLAAIFDGKKKSYRRW